MDVKDFIEALLEDDMDDSTIIDFVENLQKELDEALAKLAAMESQAKQLITKACCNAVEKLTELAPNQGWDSGEVVAEMYIRQLSDKPVPDDKPESRQDIIDVLLATRGQSEGVTADAILGLFDKPAVAVPDDHEDIDTARLRKGFGTAKGKVEQLAAYHAALNVCCDEIDRLRSKVAAATSHSQQSAIEPVEGDLLPPVGTNVAIHLASNDKWVNHKVVGYYVWGPLGGVSDSHSRVFVRVVDGRGFQNVRLLKDIKWDRCPSHESEQGGEV